MDGREGQERREGKEGGEGKGRGGKEGGGEVKSTSECSPVSNLPLHHWLSRQMTQCSSVNQQYAAMWSICQSIVYDNHAYKPQPHNKIVNRFV